ncbi:MAG TPA: exosortase system-associated protein, TIGR04073 family [Prosthecobacter sp.]|nr:exosortase system-associated protein, TIGR04073 family [Prosthecobacter sp.]
MKKRLVLTLTTLLALGSIAFGDIQSPPGHHYNWSRKLSRGVGNLLYGWTEPLDIYRRTLRSEGGVAAFSDILIEGPKRMIVRAGYGIYEVATFPLPTYKLTYRPPYYRKENIDPWWGYKDFPPEIGFLGGVDYSRNQGW